MTKPAREILLNLGRIYETTWLLMKREISQGGIRVLASNNHMNISRQGNVVTRHAFIQDLKEPRFLFKGSKQFTQSAATST